MGDRRSGEDRRASQRQLFDALVLTADVMGHEIGERAAEAMARELGAYPAGAVAAALKRCQRECKGRLTLADILQRIDDGHLGVEQAWALCPRDESASVVWTDEIAAAFGAAAPLLAEGDQIGARMAFKEAYAAALLDARAAKRGAKWWPSLGHDAAQRATTIMTAVDAGRLAPSYAVGLLPSSADFDTHRDRLLAMAENETPRELAS